MYTSRPTEDQFDSLQELLEQAGYKETRIFTPLQRRKSGSTSPHQSPTQRQTQSRNASETGTIKIHSDIDQAREAASSANWFSTIWQPKSKKQKDRTLLRKSSEPVLSRKARKAVAKEWMNFWGSGQEEAAEVTTLTQESAEPSRTSPEITPMTEEEAPIAASTSTADAVSETDTQQVRPPLRHAPSTSSLWQGSMQHHRRQLTNSRSVPSKLRERQSIQRKESYDGASVVAGVGFGAARSTNGDPFLFTSHAKSRVSLRQAFEETADLPLNTHRTTETVKGEGAGREEWRESIISLLDDNEVQNIAAARDCTDKEPRLEPAMTRKTSSASPMNLFATAATPLLSRQDAVALRNVGCLDNAEMLDDAHLFGAHDADVQPKRLRKMRSVDALELALARIDKQRSTSSGSKAYVATQSTIPESSSIESLTNEDFANAITTSTMAAETQEGETGFSIVRSLTPRLVITSPTGMRPPQPLILDGHEYEPRSFSPEVVRAVRPVATQGSTGWKIIASLAGMDSDEVNQKQHRDTTSSNQTSGSDVTKRSTSRRRTKMTKSKQEGNQPDCEALGPPSKKSLKQDRVSKSCNDLRGRARKKTVSTATEAAPEVPLTGSEQVRALRRDIVRRESHKTLRDAIRQDVTKPIRSDRSDDDDPFSDLIAITQSIPEQVTSVTSQSRSHRSSRSPAPGGMSQGRPLSILANNQSSQRPSSCSSTSSGKSSKEGIFAAAPKSSGVGIACLVEKQTRPSSSSGYISGDENAAPESPTTQIVRKKHSRGMLTQRH